MRFRTEIEREHRGGIEHGAARLLMLGSCFTDEVGALLARDGFRVTANPTGTLYNPLSVARTLGHLQGGKRYAEADLIENQGLWRSLDHHTRLCGATREEALTCINEAMAAGERALREATHVVVTWGTAWVYERQGEVVCNCHKLPAREFVRRRLTVEEIVAAWRPLIESMPDKRFIFTVSPIRHTADGLHGNELSKAALLLAAEALGVEYFPAYEALVDDLRDYRFYAPDMVHPSPVAVEYVYELFADTYFSPDTKTRAAECRRQWQRQAHRTI